MSKLISSGPFLFLSFVFLVKTRRPHFGQKRDIAYYFDFFSFYDSLECVDHISGGCLKSRVGQKKL